MKGLNDRFLITPLQLQTSAASNEMRIWTLWGNRNLMEGYRCPFQGTTAELACRDRKATRNLSEDKKKLDRDSNLTTSLQLYRYTILLGTAWYSNIDLFRCVLKFWCDAYGQHVFVLNNSAPISTVCSNEKKVKSSLLFIFATRTLWCRFLKASILHASTPTWETKYELFIQSREFGNHACGMITEKV
jgi:hypothetical protein